MLMCYARELKEGFAEYTEEVVKIMVSHLKFYFHDGTSRKSCVVQRSFNAKAQVTWTYSGPLIT